MNINTMNPITEDDIANYLANTPDFFERHAQLLAAVQLTSPHGSRAVSLQERQAEMLRDKIKALEQRINNHIDKDPQLRYDAALMTSIPGIAKTTSASLLAALGDLRRFDAPGKLVAFAGLNPARRESGTLKGQVRISKTGAPGLRAKLYFPAICAKNHNPVVRAFCERLLARGKLPIVTVCAAMRKLLHLVWGVIHTNSLFDPDYPRHRLVASAHASPGCSLA